VLESLEELMRIDEEIRRNAMVAHRPVQGFEQVAAVIETVAGDEDVLASFGEELGEYDAGVS
jgi:polyphosphate kinase